VWQDYLSKSAVSLQAAERDFANGAFDPCAGRAYFAVFQAALAALLAFTEFKKQDKSWNHYSVASEFAGRLIHRHKVFPRALAGELEDLRAYRHRADYESRSVTQRQAGQSLRRARRFVRQIQAALQKES
jgi:uncharacterized protein (UPF0332 family)